MVPTTCSFPQACLTLNIGPGGTVLRFHPVAIREGLGRAFGVRSRDSATARGLTAMATDRLAALPLVEGNRQSGTETRSQQSERGKAVVTSRERQT